MFAIALWDAARGRLVLARDRLGKKPLLWTRLADGTLAFASELKALLTLPGLRGELDPAALDAYLALQYVPGGTGLQGVEKLPPAHLLVAERGSVRVEPLLAARSAARGARRRGVAGRGARDRRQRPCAGGSSPTFRSARSSRAGSTRASSSPRWRRLGRTGAHVHGRVRRGALRRARLRARRRRALRDRARGDRRRARPRGAAAPPRGGVRRAARRRGGPAAVRRLASSPAGT